MSNWEQLELDLSELFNGHSWRADEYQLALEIAASRKIAARREYEQLPHRKAAVERAREAWRIRNPDRWREVARAKVKRWRANNRDKVLAMRRKHNRTYAEKNKERLRIKAREYRAAQRARARAA